MKTDNDLQEIVTQALDAMNAEQDQDSMCPEEKNIPRLEKELKDHDFAYSVETYGKFSYNRPPVLI